MPQYTPTHDLLWRGIPYPAGVPTTIPDDLAAALGLDTPTAPTADVPPALRLINGVDVVREVQAIPTVGAGAAKRILGNRPPGGYASLAAVWEANPELLNAPYRTDPNQIEQWGGA